MDTLNLSHQREYMTQMAMQRQKLLQAATRRGQLATRLPRDEVLATFKKQAKRVEKGRMQAIRDSETQIQSTFVPPAYAPCVLPLAELTKIRVEELRLETHHRGRYVMLRVLAGPTRMTALMGIGEDEEEAVVRVQIYQQGEEKDKGGEIWKVGGVVVVKEPYFKESGDGETGIRIDHVGDVEALPANHPLVPEAWRKGVDTITVREWLEKAEEAKKGERDWEVVDKCKAALLASPPPTPEEDREIKLKLAAAYLKVGYFESALTGLDSSPEALRISAEALYNLGRYEDCLETLGKLSDPDSALLEKTKTRLSEQETGVYDFRTVYSELRSRNPPTLDHATYVGPVEIRVSPGKGRGLFTTRDVKAGELLVLEKAFAYSFFDQSIPAEAHKTKLSMLFNTEEGSIVFGTLGSLITEAVQKMARNPSLHEFISSLHHGNYKGPSVREVDNHPVIDTFLVERIIQHNCFGCPSSSLSVHIANSPKRAYSSGLWPICATLNHSCLPTARRTFIGDLQIMRASHNLPAGTELLWPYNDVTEDIATTRRALANWGFMCDCALCVESAKTPDKVRRRRELLKKDLQACLLVPNPDSIDVAKAERLLTAADLTYKVPCTVLPREPLCHLQLMVARVHKNRGEPEKVVGAALKVLRLLGFDIRGAEVPRGKEKFEVVQWGAMGVHGIVETWVQLWVAYASVAPELCEEAEQCARTCYKICVGEDETFEDSYGRKAKKAIEDDLAAAKGGAAK